MRIEPDFLQDPNWIDADISASDIDDFRGEYVRPIEAMIERMTAAMVSPDDRDRIESLTTQHATLTRDIEKLQLAVEFGDVDDAAGARDRQTLQDLEAQLEQLQHALNEEQVELAAREDKTRKMRAYISDLKKQIAPLLEVEMRARKLLCVKAKQAAETRIRELAEEIRSLYDLYVRSHHDGITHTSSYADKSPEMGILSRFHVSFDPDPRESPGFTSSYSRDWRHEAAIFSD